MSADTVAITFGTACVIIIIAYCLIVREIYRRS